MEGTRCDSKVAEAGLKPCPPNPRQDKTRQETRKISCFLSADKKKSTDKTRNRVKFF